MSETGGTIDPEEIGRFTARADEWWNPEGSFRPLHRLNPTRLGYIRQQLGAHFGRGSGSLRPFEGLTLLDIGCGGGLIAEPMSRLGFAVTGIDADPQAIAVAQAHAEATGLAIDYRVATAESSLKPVSDLTRSWRSKSSSTWLTPRSSSGRSGCWSSRRALLLALL